MGIAWGVNQTGGKTATYSALVIEAMEYAVRVWLNTVFVATKNPNLDGFTPWSGFYLLLACLIN